MADEYANVTVNGKTFDVRVPKGSDDDFVTKAAQEHYNKNFATESRQPSLEVKRPPVINSPDFQKMERTGDQGFFASAGKNISDKFNAVTEHPLDVIRGMFPGTEQAHVKPFNNLSELANQPIPQYESDQGDTLFKATHGNIPGAVGDISPDVALGALASPKIRGAIGGGIRGIADSVGDIKINPKTSIPTAIGVGIGGIKAGWPGGLIGGAAGAIAPEIPNIMKEGMRGAVVGAADKPLIPKVIGEVDHNINIPNKTNINNSVPIRNMGTQISEGPGGSTNVSNTSHQINVAPPSKRSIITPPPPSQTLQLNQAPIITSPPQVQPPKLLNSGTQDFWRGPGSEVPRFSAEPNDEFMRRTGNVNPPTVNPPSPQNPATRYNPTQSSAGESNTPWKVLSPDEAKNLKVGSKTNTETQQVPANTRSVTEELPSSKALDLSPRPNESKSVSKPEAKAETKPSIKVNKPDYASDALKAAGLKPVEFKPAESTAKKTQVPKTESRMEELDRLIKEGRGDEKGASLKKTPKVNAPKGTKTEVSSQTEPNSITTSKETRPHFTQSIMKKIAESASTDDNKITLQEVGRHIHQNDLGTYEEGKFNKDYGASRGSKTSRKGSDNSALISEAIKKYIKDHSEEF